MTVVFPGQKQVQQRLTLSTHPLMFTVQNGLLDTHSERRSTTLAYHQLPSGSPFPGSTIVLNVDIGSEAPQSNRQYHSQQDQRNSTMARHVRTPTLAISPVQDHVGYGYGKDSNTLEDLNVKESWPSSNMDDPFPSHLSPTARSTTIVSNGSSRGRTRTTNRLSYLAHLETIEAEDDRDYTGGTTPSQAKFTGPTEMISDRHHSTLCAPNGPQSGAVSVQHRSHTHRPNVTENPCITSAPPIPSLYRRLLRVFRPPTESSSESDSGGYTEPAELTQHVTARQPTRSRGVFGLPSSPESSSRRSRSIQKSEKQVMACPSSSSVAAQLHRPPDHMGFRARFLKNLTSSPHLSSMLHPAAVAPEAPANTSPSSCSLCHQDCPVGESSSPSPLVPDFEHENSCPAGKRIQERQLQGRPRATTTPTLQSKYGTPGRELGAGTQAQVMLLRVKSSKHLRGTQRKDMNKYQQSQQPSSKDELTLADHSHSGDLLSSHSRSGNFKTTTEDEVTPSQREAYRKRLLHRASTGGLSTTENGGLIYAIKKFRPPKATETHRQYLKKVCAEFCIATSMDHENIIRTIDLVRDHPGQDPLENEDVEESSNKDDHRDCNCSKEHHHRISASVGTEAQRHRPILRKSVVFRPQQNQSVDTLPLPSKRTLGEHSHPCNPSPSGQVCQHDRQMERPRYQDQVDRVASVGLSQITTMTKKKKLQVEQELRQKEIQRLKQQRQREKQQAEQWRLDQFPEYCMVMEFAAGGDLFNLLTTSYPPISLHEKHCLWRQLVNGVQYMHSIGVAVSHCVELVFAFSHRYSACIANMVLTFWCGLLIIASRSQAREHST